MGNKKTYRITPIKWTKEWLLECTDGVPHRALLEDKKLYVIRVEYDESGRLKTWSTSLNKDLAVPPDVDAPTIIGSVYEGAPKEVSAGLAPDQPILEKVKVARKKKPIVIEDITTYNQSHFYGLAKTAKIKGINKKIDELDYDFDGRLIWVTIVDGNGDRIEVPEELGRKVSIGATFGGRTGNVDKLRDDILNNKNRKQSPPVDPSRLPPLPPQQIPKPVLTPFDSWENGLNKYSRDTFRNYGYYTIDGDTDGFAKIINQLSMEDAYKKGRSYMSFERRNFQIDFIKEFNPKLHAEQEEIRRQQHEIWLQHQAIAQKKQEEEEILEQERVARLTPEEADEEYFWNCVGDDDHRSQSKLEHDCRRYVEEQAKKRQREARIAEERDKVIIDPEEEQREKEARERYRLEREQREKEARERYRLEREQREKQELDEWTAEYEKVKEYITAKQVNPRILHVFEALAQHTGKRLHPASREVVGFLSKLSDENKRLFFSIFMWERMLCHISVLGHSEGSILAARFNKTDADADSMIHGTMNKSGIGPDPRIE